MRPGDRSAADTFATWGDLFEVGVKRGCLALLRHRALLPDDPHLAPWAETQVADLIEHLNRQLGVTDPTARERHSRALQHLLLLGWGLGWTVLRGTLDRLASHTLRPRGLFCPLSLPVRPSTEPDARAHEELWQALHLPGAPDPAWLGKGQPARADFLLWLGDGEGRQHVYALEFSLNATPEVRDFRDPEPHLEELLSHAARLEGRGIFTRVGAMLTDERFAFSDRIVAHLAALTTQDKPLYKLAQASAYATSFLRNLHERRIPIVLATAHAIAITNSGVEAVEAEFADPPTPRWKLMRALGEAYPRVPHPGDDDRRALDRELTAVRDQIVRALPIPLRDAVEEALDAAELGRRLDLRLHEPVSGFANPATPISWDVLAEGIEESPAVCTLLGSVSPRADLAAACGAAPAVTLRDVHAATLRQAIARAPAGRITVLAAEGMPGIGKTTSIREALRARPDGFLWLYASPRLVINEDVLRGIACPEDRNAPGVVALTTNSRLIDGAGAWWREQNSSETRRRVDGAVLCLGPELAVRPVGSILFVDQQQAQEIDARYAGANLQKRTLDEGTDMMRPAPRPGVLQTLAGAARDLLDQNPGLDRLVLSASVQGFRSTPGDDGRGRARTTVERLSHLFHERAATPAALYERVAFARRIPTIVVMVDEIAGDGAGAPFVHELGRWLHREFIAPFVDAGQPSPFQVILVLADASLANDDVLRSFLEHEEGAPEKVIVSPSRGAMPFRVAAGNLRIGGRSYATLHVMADGFPAASLSIDYHLTLTPVLRPTGARASAARALIARQEGDRVRHDAAQTIFDALTALPSDQQVIFFAQDKRLLRDVRKALLQPEAARPDELPPLESHGVSLAADEVALLDSSVSDRERQRLIEPAGRDRQRVFLMTSSGARGVSFPRAATLIGLVPRFAVESGFMEIAQLVYRGRGGAGDFLDRRLVMLLQDFVVADAAIDERQWLRRTLDLLSALLLLRATIFTRVTGDAGLRNQRAAVVPVGPIGADEVAANLSQAVGPFLRESGIYLHEASDPGLLGLVANAQAAVLETFTDLTQRARLPKGRPSALQPEFLDHLARRITGEHLRLLDDAHPLSLPDHLFVTGPLWLESWEGLSIEESFDFRGHSRAEIESITKLRSRLHRIGGEYRHLPRPLTKAARDLERLLNRPESLRGHRFQVRRDVVGGRLWVCVPLDYPTFVFTESAHGRQVRRLDDDDQSVWRDAFVRVVSTASAPLAVDPVIPRYRENPFLTFQTVGDPTGLDRAFDGRYFMASTELNLLNTILFVE